MTNSNEILACGGCTHVPQIDQSKLPKIEPVIDLSERRTTRQMSFLALQEFGLTAESIAELEKDGGIKISPVNDKTWTDQKTNKTFTPDADQYILLNQKLKDNEVVTEYTLYKSLARTALAYSEEIFGQSEGNAVFTNNAEHQSPLMFISSSRFVCGFKANTPRQDLSILMFEGRLERFKTKQSLQE